MHRVKCIVHRVNYIDSNTESEVHRVEYPTYLRLNHLGISIFLSKDGTSTDAIDRECNPLRGFAWSSARTRGKVATFRRDAHCVDWRGRAPEREVKLQFVGAPRNPLRGLAWSSVRTREKVATFRRDAQPFAWIGVVERANAR